jgi:protein-disulfide isomerase
MNKRIEQALSAVVTLCAVLVAGIVFHDHLVGRRNLQALNPRPVRGWDSLLATKLRIGDHSAPVKIVEFGDFRCPFCAEFHSVFEDVFAGMRGSVSLTFRHLPVGRDSLSTGAALAAQCAGEAGHFAEMAHELFGAQDSLGKKPWVAFATAAGVRDIVAFEECLEDSLTGAKIARDRKLAADQEIFAVPTVLINGFRYPVAPMDSLRVLVENMTRSRSRPPRD